MKKKFKKIAKALFSYETEDEYEDLKLFMYYFNKIQFDYVDHLAESYFASWYKKNIDSDAKFKVEYEFSDLISKIQYDLLGLKMYYTPSWEELYFLIVECPDSNDIEHLKFIAYNVMCDVGKKEDNDLISSMSEKFLSIQVPLVTYIHMDKYSGNFIDSLF